MPDQRPHLLLTTPYPDWDMEPLHRDFIVSHFWQADDPAAFLTAVGPMVRAIATTGGVGADAQLIAACPRLEIIANYGVGYDKVDVPAAKARNIIVTNTPDVLTDDVADLTIGLILATLRRIPQNDALVRQGLWGRGALPFGTRVTGKRIGIAGFGRIGQAVAKRAVGFDADIAYFARHERLDSPYSYFAQVDDLARWADILVVLVPGGPDTECLISVSTLRALGPKGYLINASRGSTVDEAALLTALETKSIAGAGLDVFNHEPDIDPRFFTLENVVLQPHIGSLTEATRRAMGQLVRDNLTAHFAGQPVLTPV